MSFTRDLRDLWRSPGFRRLATVRLLSQAGDGAYLVGIFASFFFDPERGATAGEIAAGFFVMFAPFTLVGPFVGPLVDRWHRQRILAVGNLLRVGLAAGLIAAIVANAPTVALYAIALVTLSVNRFLLAALSAGLPRVVPADELVTANALMPTLGTLAASAGGVLSGQLVLLLPRVTDLGESVVALGLAALGFAASSFAATRIARTGLGPDALTGTKAAAAHAVHLLRELRAGVRHLYGRRTPFNALVAMAAARHLYALVLVSFLLIARQLWAGGDADAAIGNVAGIGAFAVAGFGLSVVVTPMVAPRLGHHRWIAGCLFLGALGQVALATGASRPAVYVAAVVLSFAVQAGKIGVDTVVQRDTDDAFRGRAFTLYDVAYNVAFISAAGLGVLVLPDSGYSRITMTALVGAYLLAAALFWRSSAVAREQPERSGTEAATAVEATTAKPA